VTDLVNYSLTGGVATITMNDGKANCLSVRMLGELTRALERAEADRASVILTGREQRFSAGFDLAVFKEGREPVSQMLLAGFELGHRMLSYPRPLVAACNGHALAMGAFLLLVADVRVGARGPFKLGANEVAIGLTMPHAALEFCRQRIAPSYLTRVVITAEIFAPDDAVRAGFLDRVVEPAELQSEALAIATRLGQLDMPAFTDTKRRMREGTLASLRAAIELDAVDLRA
jgi:enoyl-CoA hydratase